MNMFDYNPPKLKEGVFKISPSSLYKFSEKTHEWFSHKFLGEDLFVPNTGSVTGTIVHEILDCYVSDRTEPTTQQIQTYVDSIQGDESYSTHEVMMNYEVMARLGKDWIDKQEFHSAEEYISHELAPNICVAGTYDGVTINPDGSQTVIDYKTTYGGLAPKKMEAKHRWQLLCYASILNKHGWNITHIEAVYISRYKPGKVSEKTGKTGKAYPSLLTPIREPITDDSLQFIDSLIDLVFDTVQFFFENPQHANICFKDQRLKGRPFDELVKIYKLEKEEEEF